VHAGAKVLDVLDAFDAPGPGLTLTELTQKLGLPKSTVLRLLRTLENRGYLERQADSGRYQLGFKLFGLGSRVAARFDVVDVAGPVMARLREACGDTVNLGVLDGLEVVFVAVLESLHPLRKTARVGDREPAYCTASGRAMLAHLPPAEARTLLESGRLVPLTPRTNCDLGSLLDLLVQVRRRGVAMDDEETVPGARCVGAAVLDHRGAVCAGISVSGPVFRLDDDRLPEVARFVQAAGQEVSRRLGYRRTVGDADYWADQTRTGASGRKEV
jgi:DNA-binding IclR family transcriptional regulator